MFDNFHHFSKNLGWWLKNHIYVPIGALVVIVGSFFGWYSYKEQVYSTKEEVRGAVILLRQDFVKNMEKLDGTYSRYFKGLKNGGMHGEVTKIGEDGECWGFDVFFSKPWIETGAGDVEIKDLKKVPNEVCEDRVITYAE